MRLLLDTNILLDHLLERSSFSDKTDLLMSLGAIGEFDLYISVSQITDALYILSSGGKKSRLQAAKEAMAHAREHVHIAALDEADVDAVLDSDWEDLEDACVYQAARGIRADAIITRNLRDFGKSSIPVFDCPGFFDWMKREHGVDYAAIDF